MEIDIRKEQVRKIDCIRFGNVHNNIIWDNGNDHILFEHESTHSSARIKVLKASIPDLIKALEKAMELWG